MSAKSLHARRVFVRALLPSNSTDSYKDNKRKMKKLMVHESQISKSQISAMTENTAKTRGTPRLKAKGKINLASDFE